MKAIRALSCLLVAGAVTGCSLLPSNRDTIEVRFRTIVEVSDRGVLRRGQAVWSYARIEPNFPLVDHLDSRFVAEAIPIRADNGEWLFVLPASLDWSTSGADWVRRTFDIQRLSGDAEASALENLAQSVGKTARFTCTRYPDVMTVRKGSLPCPSILRTDALTDPHAFKIEPRGDKASPSRDVFVSAIELSITTDAPTDRLSAMLPWLKRAEEAYRARHSGTFEESDDEKLPQQVNYIRLPLFRSSH